MGWILQLAEWPEPHPSTPQRRVTEPGHRVGPQDGEDPSQPRTAGKRKAQRHQPSGDPAPTGLHNGANVCYINAVVQALFLIPPIHVALPPPSLTPPTSICAALRNVFEALAQGAVEQRTVDGYKRLQPTLPAPYNDNGNQQHDAAEFLLAMMNDSASDMMARPLTGHDGYTIHCPTCDSTWASEPTQFKSLQLALPTGHEGPPPRIETLIHDEQRRPETVDCGCRTPHCTNHTLHRTWSMAKAPETLVVTLRRFAWDKAAKQTKKVSLPVDCSGNLSIRLREPGSPVVKFPATPPSASYRLHAAILHRGTEATNGHYVLIGMETLTEDRQPRYWQYNDAVVTTLSARLWDKIISGACPTRGTPYMLFYCRNDRVPTPIEALARGSAVAGTVAHLRRSSLSHLQRECHTLLDDAVAADARVAAT